MNTFQELIMLGVTVLFIGMILTLLILKIITIDNPLVTFILASILNYWGFRSASYIGLNNPPGGSLQPPQATTPQAKTP